MKRSGLFVALLVFYGLIAWSPIISRPGTGSMLLIGLLAGLSFLIFFERRRIAPRLLLILLAYLISIFSAALFWTSTEPLIGGAWIVIGFLLWAISTGEEQRRFVDFSLLWVVILLVGAYVAFATAALGAPPIAELTNPDGRPNFLFYGSLTNVHLGQFIRPSGVYDEPGAFSFVVCVVVALRYYFGKNDLLNIVVLIAGLITFSLAHLIFLLLFLIVFGVQLQRVVLLSALLGLFALFVIQVGLGDRIALTANRIMPVAGNLATVGTPVIAGDNRSEYMARSIDVIGRYDFSWFFGYGPDCILDSKCGGRAESLCCEPLSLLAKRGIVQSWPYWVALFGLLIAPALRGKAGLVALAVGLLIMQRPNLFSMGYSLLIILILSAAFNRQQRGLTSSRITQRFFGVRRPTVDSEAHSNSF